MNIIQPKKRSIVSCYVNHDHREIGKSFLEMEQLMGEEKSDEIILPKTRWFDVKLHGERTRSNFFL